MASSHLEERVVRAAEAALAEQSYVSPVDVLLRRICGARAESKAWSR